jgi:hypothetical protein
MNVCAEAAGCWVHSKWLAAQPVCRKVRSCSGLRWSIPIQLRPRQQCRADRSLAGVSALVGCATHGSRAMMMAVTSMAAVEVALHTFVDPIAALSVTEALDP